MDKKLKNILIVISITLPIIVLLITIDSRQTNTKIGENKQEEATEHYYSEIRQEPEDNTNLNYDYTECINCDTELKEAVDTYTLKQAAWIPPWDYNNGISSLNGFETAFYSVSPVTFSVNSNGTLTPRLDTQLTPLKEVTQDKQIKLIPTISNFDSNVMKEVLNNPTNRQRHIDSIVEAVINNNYDGIDLDYESISLESKEAFLEFIKDLYERLNQEQKILSITVLPKWGDDVVYTGLRETREVQDWREIAKYAHQVRIMTYDFTSPSSSTPGPIAPTNWMQKVLEYAVETIPKEKIWLGIHLYSYEWVMPTKDSQNHAIKTNSYTYDFIRNSIISNDYVHVNYNQEFEEGYADYPCTNNNHCVLYYATPESVSHRQNLASKYGIAGVVYWRLGGEGDLIR